MVFPGRFLTDKHFALSCIEKASFTQELFLFAFYRKAFLKKLSFKKFFFPHELIQRAFPILLITEKFI